LGRRKKVLWEYALTTAGAGSAILVVRQTETDQEWIVGSFFGRGCICLVHRTSASAEGKKPADP
jgi:hypothetical protein